MSTRTRFLAVGAMMVLGILGCSTMGDRAGRLDDPSPGSVSQVEQADTGCELDCPGNPPITCAAPCSVSDGTLTCSGVPTVCPPCTPTTCLAANADCGVTPDGCGHMLDCGTCASGYECVSNSVSNTCELTCPQGRVDCCGRGTCIPFQICAKLDCGT
jgi:hypothetical protein